MLLYHDNILYICEWVIIYYNNIMYSIIYEWYDKREREKKHLGTYR